MKPTIEQLKNRYSYHPPKEGQAARYEAIRAKVLELAIFVVENTPASREQSVALTHLDDVMYNANAAIARNE